MISMVILSGNLNLHGEIMPQIRYIGYMVNHEGDHKYDKEVIYKLYCTALKCEDIKKNCTSCNYVIKEVV
jgi:hypothetical protein